MADVTTSARDIVHVRDDKPGSLIHLAGGAKKLERVTTLCGLTFVAAEAFQGVVPDARACAACERKAQESQIDRDVS